eukprot:1041738-Amphidinium_carterae.1
MRLPSHVANVPHSCGLEGASTGEQVPHTNLPQRPSLMDVVPKMPSQTNSSSRTELLQCT